MNHSGSSHSRRRRHTEPFGRLGRQAPDGRMARFAFEALEIELTEGQPDIRQTKQTKRNPEL